MGQTVKSLILVTHTGRPAALEAARQLRILAEESGVEVVPEGVAADVVVALGGDGTILRAAGLALSLDAPLLGVNLGNLGFLSTVDVSRLDRVVKGLKENEFTTDERMMLDARVYQSAKGADVEVARVAALNEVLVERGTASRIISIKVTVGSEQVAVYEADGFIVSTPTGSTAYSLSAGGPVVEPTLDAMVLTSVSAHAPLWRSIVVGPSREVTLEMPDDRTSFSSDGQQVVMLEAGGKIVVRPHPKTLKLLTLHGKAFYSKLRSRFRIEPSMEQ
ncbi:MAG: NAD(+)/NADH kinase [Actinomycetota bacterium]